MVDSFVKCLVLVYPAVLPDNEYVTVKFSYSLSGANGRITSTLVKEYGQITNQAKGGLVIRRTG